MISAMMDSVRALVPNWLMRSVGGYWDWGDDRYDRHLTAEKFITSPTIYYGLTKIAGKIARLPIDVYKVEEDGTQTQDKAHNVYQLLRRPNEYQTPCVYLEQFLSHSIIDGNGRSAIVRRGNRIMELIPLLPECTVTVMIGGEKLHATRPGEDDRLRLFFDTIDGSDNGIISLSDRDVVHVPGLSLDGVSGLPLRKIGQRNVGASIAAEERIAKQFDSGFTGNIVIEAPAGIFRNEKDAENFIENWKEKHHKKSKSGEPALLREGMKLTVVQTSNKDAEMVENRKFMRQDGAMYMGLDWIHGDDSNALASIRERNAAELDNTLARHISRCEQEWERKLLAKKDFDRGLYIIRIDTSEIKKADYFSTMDLAKTGIESTLVTVNEGREWLGLNPVDGGDVLRNPQPGGGGIDKQPSNDAATQAMLENLIGVEAKRVQDGAERASNFIEWIDNFYDKKWMSLFADKLESIGLDRDLAVAHCRQSKRLLLDACDRSTKEDLADNVSAAVKDWKNRAAKVRELEYV